MDLQRFKDALACAPTSVVVVTTRDGDGTPRGFTAGSFSSLSLDPPLILVSLNRRAECHPSFQEARHFAVSVLGPEHQELARLMATRGAEKFSGDHFLDGLHGLPLAQEAVATFVCRLQQRHQGGDHTILIGEVLDAEVNQATSAMVHFKRSFFAVGESCDGNGR